MPNTRDIFLLFCLPPELKRRLQAVHNVQVPDLDDGLHGANRHQVPLRLRLGVERKPFCKKKFSMKACEYIMRYLR